MTRDAFYKAQELEKKLDAVHQLQNIITNSTLSKDNDYYKTHNNHVRKDEMVLCYMCKDKDVLGQEKFDITIKDEIDNSYGNKIKGNFYMAGNFIFGKDVPVDLVERLERVLFDYEREINKEFEDLSSDYVNEEED